MSVLCSKTVDGTHTPNGFSQAGGLSDGLPPLLPQQPRGLRNNLDGSGKNDRSPQF